MSALRTLLLLLSCYGMLLGLDFKEADATYRIRFGWVGVIGSVNASLKIERGRYLIRMEADAEGVAKLLSGHRKEIYESRGRYVGGILRPDLYIKRVSHSGKSEEVRYLFDHKRKQITVRIRSSEEAGTKERVKRLGYYAVDDLMSLYFNLPALLKHQEAATRLALHAVGANPKDGHLDLIVPDARTERKLRRLVKGEGRIVKVVVYRKIFTSKRGEFILLLDRRGFCRRGVLKDLFFFGDVTADLTHLHISPSKE